MMMPLVALQVWWHHRGLDAIQHYLYPYFYSGSTPDPCASGLCQCLLGGEPDGPKVSSFPLAARSGLRNAEVAEKGLPVLGGVLAMSSLLPPIVCGKSGIPHPTEEGRHGSCPLCLRPKAPVELGAGPAVASATLRDTQLPPGTLPHQTFYTGLFPMFLLAGGGQVCLLRLLANGVLCPPAEPARTQAREGPVVCSSSEDLHQIKVWACLIYLTLTQTLPSQMR